MTIWSLVLMCKEHGLLIETYLIGHYMTVYVISACNIVNCNCSGSNYSNNDFICDCNLPAWQAQLVYYHKMQD